ncbi:MAG: PQQ-dependent sugar dehydrogenase [Acidobacteriota bacterium]|nr:PQQ-dependent sugar dehydrogenase [Acidobacteriota bacterium]
MKKRISCILAVLVFGVVAATAQMPDIQRQQFLSGLSRPVLITNAGDGSNRLFVVQQRGLIRVVEPGSTTPTTFLDLSGVASQTGSERGLLGLAFHPDFENNSFFFVNYTRGTDGATVIARYKAINNNTIGDPASAVTIIVISQDFSNHNGGHIAVGPDNNLYIGMGDGGSANDPNNRAQDIDSLLGKMLRITPSISETVGKVPYTNPPDNPYVGIAGRDEIYAIGLRNPYRWSFDRGGTHQLWVADVGQFAIEEVSIVENGGNYGWRVYEGNSCTNNDFGLCTPSNYDPPIFEYGHTGGRCSITGGYVYRGNRSTFPQGSYIYGDYCTGEYWVWDGANQQLIEDTPRSISGFGEDEAGELYLVNLGGTVEKIINVNSPTSSPRFDFDGDFRSDISIFRPGPAEWWYLRSSDGGNAAFQFGQDTDTLVPADYTGDGKADIAFFRPSSGEWFVLRSEDSSFYSFPFGANGDIPVPGDYDGDGVSDAAVFRPSDATWFINNSSGNTTIETFGAAGDRPVIEDFDGDGKDDISIFRPSVSEWWQLRSTEGVIAFQFGNTGDSPVPGDYTGDGKADAAFFRHSGGEWFVLRSEDFSFYSFPFGVATDIPVAGDYDGDGVADVGVFRPSSSTWFILGSTSGVQINGFGAPGDIPVPSTYIP